METSDQPSSSSGIRDEGIEEESALVLPNPIRKRRFSSARIQPTRVKKVMQSDDEIGRMVASVPVAIGSAMELFAEKLISSAAGCLHNSTTKTLSPIHIKYAMFNNPEFSFLETTLKDVPLPKLGSDYQHNHGAEMMSFTSQAKSLFNDQTSQFSLDIKPFRNYKMKKEIVKTEVDTGLVIKRKRGRPPKVRTDQGRSGSAATDVENSNYRIFNATYEKVREHLKKALDADESRRGNCPQVSKARVVQLYHRAIREMNEALSFKPSSCPINKREEIILQQSRIEKFLSDCQDRVAKLEEKTNCQGINSVATTSARIYGGQKLNTRVRDKATFLRNVNAKYGDEILSTIVDNANIKLADVDGNLPAKKALEESVIFPAMNPNLFTGLRAPCKGILLFGPPGNGKTLIAKAVATECGSVFFNISAANIMSKWVGDGERIVQALFQIARNAQPSIIFIDEIDSMLCERSENEQGAARRIKTEFLVQLDGCVSGDNDRILVLGATNRPQELDEGILRRFPQRIFIDLPDDYSRAEMIMRTYQKHNTRTDMRDKDFYRIAKLTDGYSYSDLMALCRAAALIPVSELAKSDLQNASATNLRSVNYPDMEMALRTVRPSTNPENRKKLLEFAQKYAQL